MDQSIFASVDIPNKSTFKINEVCALTGVKSYVLRFWETEFDVIAPLPSSSGQKLYELKDIEAILLIKKLLFDDKLTIEKAKHELHKLLPERKLLDERFVEEEVEAQVYKKSEVQDKIIKEFSPEIISKAENVRSHDANDNDNVDPIQFNALEIEKLKLAKNKLQAMLNFIQEGLAT